jgi:hypothetical protein
LLNNEPLLQQIASQTLSENKRVEE